MSAMRFGREKESGNGSEGGKTLRIKKEVEELEIYNHKERKLGRTGGA